jgi:hypothetical protein
VGGFHLNDVPSLQEAKAWALRVPTGLGSDDILEIRRLTGEQDIAGRHERLRDRQDV